MTCDITAVEVLLWNFKGRANGRRAASELLWHVQVISLLRPAKVQMGLVAPSAQHVTGLLQHVEQMLVILKEMHQQLKQAHAMSS